MEYKTSDLNMNPTMTAAETFENILLQIQNSNLNFKLNLSPFTANISLKKTLVTDKSGIPLVPRPNTATCENIATLTAKNHELENNLIDIKNEFASTVNEYGTAVHQELADSLELVNKLQIVKENLVKENEALKIANKNKDAEIQDLDHSNKIRKEVTEKLHRNINELKAKFHKEKIDIAKQNKLEIKYWRKQLGEETKANIKLKERLEKRVEDAKGATKKSKKKAHKQLTS